MCGNALVQDNIISGTSGDGVWVRSDYWVPKQVSLQRNIFKGFATPIRIVTSYSSITQTGNYKL